MERLRFFTILSIFCLNGCNLPELPEIKELNSESEQMYDQVLKELKAENIVYSYKGVNNDGTKKIYFKMRIENVTNLELTDEELKRYNHKILSIFDKSNFDFSAVDEYIFYYMERSSPPSKLRIYFELDSNRNLMEIAHK